ncbi:thymidine kinase [Dictyocaulus viviparus]|uniref:Thymidine kinase n=1 Tax=Dictyocaulus viviparus TaxID=29172 RepID=A0A0D8Y440_DICVI|nr:thymidine kinase [Dictyocaulus viviparus]
MGPYHNCHRGRIVCIVGPMFSGKTTELIRMHDRYKIAGKTCVLVKYAGDTRYDPELVITHKRVTAEGSTLIARTLRDVRSELFAAETDVVAIDEGQFFNDLSYTCDQLALEGKIVIVAALDGSFLRKPFPEVSQLIPISDEVKKLSAVCMKCGDDAPFTFRSTNEKAVEVIGGEDTYQALCRFCYYTCSIRKNCEGSQKG